MSIVDRWLLPDGVEDVLPLAARQLETIRRRLLDLYATWGYDYVIPPMIEFLESLLTGTGRDLDLKTFKVVDLITGRTMGVRADITPQVARIDAHSLNRAGVSRLCYAGTVVQAKSDNQLSSRTPLSVGAELFGDNSSAADIEIVSLMVESLKSLGFTAIHVDLGDVAIFRQLMDRLDLSTDQIDVLFESVQRKAAAEIRQHTRSFGLPEAYQKLLCALPGLAGDRSMLADARALFAGMPEIQSCIDNLETVADAIAARFTNLDIYFDLSELRGYAYHTGIVFAAFIDGLGQEVAKGGRYDEIGQVFGRDARGATGFSINVTSLLNRSEFETVIPPRVIVVQMTETEQGGIDLEAKSSAMWLEIQQLRAKGYVVLETGEHCEGDSRLIFQQGQWQLIE